MRRLGLIMILTLLLCRGVDLFKFGVIADWRVQATQPKQESTIPDTPVGRHLAGWLRAYNSGDIEAVRRFIAENYDKSHLQRGPNPVDFFFSSLYPETRDLIFNRILYANEHKIMALVQSALTGVRYRIIVRTAESPPQGMFIQGIGGDQAPDDVTGFKKLTDDAISSQVRAYLDKLV